MNIVQKNQTHFLSTTQENISKTFRCGFGLDCIAHYTVFNNLSIDLFVANFKCNIYRFCASKAGAIFHNLNIFN